MNNKTVIRNTHSKYVDDLAIAQAMTLKNVLTVDSTEVWERPLKYHNRTEQKLNPENSQMQAQLSEPAVYANTNDMKINQNKSKVMDIYVKDVRSVVEFAAVVRSSSLTKGL